MTTLETTTWQAPAKLNLFLHVVGRRDDGYHLLQSAMRLVDLADVVSITPRDDGRIVRDRDLPGVPEDTDLTIRAARLLQSATGTTRGAAIGVEKRIPMGGGLGGGSSDAATTLLALNHLWRTGLTRAQLMTLGLALGADVPFFIGGGDAFVEGVGERLTPATFDEARLCGRPSRRRGADRGRLRGCRIDKGHATPQNFGLFDERVPCLRGQRLRDRWRCRHSKRSRAGGRRTLRGGPRRAGLAVAGRPGCTRTGANERFGGVGVSRIRSARAGDRACRRAAARLVRLERAESRRPPPSLARFGLSSSA